MRLRSFVFVAILAVLQLHNKLWASPTTSGEAKMAVTGWLIASPQPFNTSLQRRVSEIETFTDGSGEPVYYIVYLDPSGFVIVSADDSIEPIIAFADDGIYDPSVESPLGVLVTKDLNARILDIQNAQDSTAHIEQLDSNPIKQKWSFFIELASGSNENLKLASSSPICDDYISDIRVAPLIRSKWGQSYYYGRNSQQYACFNYYTPQLIDDEITFIDDQIENYPSGCIATAMAQLMRYHMYPYEAIESREFSISVDWLITKRSLLRGHDPGGKYNWSDMIFIPDDNTTDQQRQAIGAICHDAGVAVGTQYTATGSGAYMRDVMIALVDTFGYNQAIWGANEGENFDGQSLIEIINSNLDANSPVILGIQDSYDITSGHAAICDGYGYNSSTLYHHLNIGWYGIDDCWYNLPNIACPNAGTFDTITECIYNIFSESTGEIISGRISDNIGFPVKDVTVTAQKTTGGRIYTTTTNDEGIYAFRGLPSYTTYTITADKNGYDFDIKEADTGRSYDGSSVSGNKWGVDLQGYNNCVSVTIGTGTSQWDYPMHTYYHDSRTQVIYLADEIGTAGTITALALNVTDTPDEPLENWTIRMKHTTMSEYNTPSLDATGWTIAYQNDESVDTGWQTFEFQIPFEYNGTDNLLVDFSYNNSLYTEDGYCSASNPGPKRSAYACSDSQHGDPLNWSSTNSPSISLGGMIPNIKLNIGRESQVISGDIKLIAFDGQAEDLFGCSVSISGDYAIVGAKGANECRGAAYIYKRDGTGWTRQTRLMADKGEPDEYFGCSVSINGDYAVIGVEGNSQFDYIDIFKREGTNWIQQDRLSYSNGSSTYYTGPSVSINGDYIIAGAKYSRPGTTYIFKNNGGKWTQKFEFNINTSITHDYFGSSVAICEDYAISSTGQNDTGGTASLGSAYIFKREGAVWSQQTRLASPDGSWGNSFGYSASICGDFALIGANEDNENGNYSGSAYIFSLEGADWIEQVKLLASDGSPGDRFGSSVFIRGDYAFIGAPYNDDDINGSDCGSVYIFQRESVNWEQKKKLAAFDAETDDRYGNSVSIGGDCIIIGAEGDDDNGHNSGSAYIYRLDEISGV